MTRVRTTVLGGILAIGLAASAARAADADTPWKPPAAPSHGATSPATPPTARPSGGFFHWLFKEGPKRPSHKDWSTGRDDRLSKPWLTPIH